MPEPCPSVERLAAVLRSSQPGSGDAELAAHLDECPACQAQLEALAGGSGWLEAKARTHEVTASTSSAPLEQVMQALERRTGDAGHQAATPPKFDFLQPSELPGVLGKFGPYEVLEHIASGGMGIVLKARDPGLDRIVALKILPPALAANALARARFVREACAAAAVVHEHVVSIYAVDEVAGLPCIVMQFVQGQTLSERIRATGRLRLEEILRIGAQTAAGLAAAHAQGLVHRDVKPGNILLENSVERVKLTDFGLARAVDDAGLTRTGELAGTPEFMSPEQAGNEVVDHRADLFSLGSVLYAMSTSCSPFQGNTVVAVVRSVCDAHPPSVHELNPAVPRWLSDIIARLMAKSPAERFQSAQEVAELLERYLARVHRGELGELPDHREVLGRACAAPGLLTAASPGAKAAEGRGGPKRWRGHVGTRVTLGAAAALVALALLFFMFKERHGVSPPSSPPSKPAPFVVRSKSGASLGAFVTSEAALNAAPADSVLELCWDGPRNMPPLDLADKPLTVRAGEGSRPIWIHGDPARPAIASRAALTLEGVEIVLRADEAVLGGESFRGTEGPRRSRRAFASSQGERFPPSGVGLISISNAPLRLRQCIVQLDDPRTRAGARVPLIASLAAIALDDVSDCELEDSALLALPGRAILWKPRWDDDLARRSGPNREREGALLRLHNCLVLGLQAFRVDLPAETTARLQMVRCTFTGPNLVYFPKQSAGRTLDVVAQSNVFATGVLLRDEVTLERSGLTSSMHWRGSENLYDPRLGYIALAEDSKEPVPQKLADWNDWWGQVETGSRRASVVFSPPEAEVDDLTGSAFILARFTISEVHVLEGPPLATSEWDRFGAETDKVWPSRSVKALE